MSLGGFTRSTRTSPRWAALFTFREIKRVMMIHIRHTPMRARQAMVSRGSSEKFSRRRSTSLRRAASTNIELESMMRSYLS
jgi:hypothetical protein